MANNFDLSNLTEIIYAARDKVAREMVGFIPSVTVNGGSEQVSLGGTVESLRTVEGTISTSLTPAMTPPDGDDVTPAKETLTIGQTAVARIPMQGESALKLRNTGQGRLALENTFAQHMRKIVNAIEIHVGTVLKNGSSRAVGTAGTTPFASNHNVINSLRKVLDDNGCPLDGARSLIINSTAGVNLRNLSTLTKANEAGSTDPLRRGTLLDISDFMIKESAGVRTHTKGTGTSYQTNGAAAVGATALTLDTGSGTILAGDVITHADDAANAYVVGSALASNVVTLNRPGLLVAAGDNKAITVGNNYTANIGFHRSAVELVIRPPAVPDQGDLAVDRMVLFDEVSGLSFEIALYPGYRMVVYEIACHYQAKVWNPEFVATLMG